MKIAVILILAMFFSYSYAQQGQWNYTVTTETSNPISMSGAANLGMGGDDVTISSRWPFNGWIYNDYYTFTDSIHINSNGIMRFDKNLWIGAGSTTSYPTFPTNNTTFGQCISYGGNSDGHIAGNIIRKVSGSTGSRIVTYAFTYYTNYTGTTSYHADIQINIYEANRKIRIDYANVGGNSSPALHLAINAGDNIWGGDFAASFPTSDVAYLFTPGPIVSMNPVIKTNNLELNIMPNPSSDIFHLEIENKTEESLDIKIYNSLGQTIVSKYIPENAGITNFLTFDLSSYSKGVYYIRLQSSFETVLRKVILQ